MRKYIFLLLTLLPLYCPAEVKIGLSSSANAQRSGSYFWALAFADSLRSSGMEATIYPGSTLGNEIVRSEQVLLGLLEVNISGGRDLTDASDLYATLELPFLFRDVQEVTALIETTDYLDQVNAQTGPRGILVADMAYLGGMSGLFTAKQAIRSISDTPRFRLRAMTAQQLDFFEAWGAAGTQVAWEEISQALQTGIADGYLNAPMVPVLFGHGGQLDYFTELRLQPSMRAVVLSRKWYLELAPSQQAMVDKAILHARTELKAWLQKTISVEFEMLDQIGIEVIELAEQDREMFRARLLPMYARMAPEQARRKMNRYLEEIRSRQ